MNTLLIGAAALLLASAAVLAVEPARQRPTRE
jgi:hypothetical protein